jgi:hypothetical protein
MTILTCLVSFAQQPTSNPSASASDTAVRFLNYLNKGQVPQALELWDRRAVNDALKKRIEKMPAKLAKLGGINRVDIGTVEARRVERYLKDHGEKIDVVPVEIPCGNENVVLAVFSVRKIDGEYRIFMLESLKEWGGTASLDDEVGYSH